MSDTIRVMSLTGAVLNELEANAQGLHDADFAGLYQAISEAGHVFCAGKGRSLMAISAFCNRLVHLGYPASLVGEISAPHADPDDLLVVGSSSGETDALVSLARTAKREGVRVAVLTSTPDSTLGSMADAVVYIPGASKLAGSSSIQPMGASFEQLLWISLDALVLGIMERTGTTGTQMYVRHANLE